MSWAMRSLRSFWLVSDGFDQVCFDVFCIFFSFELFYFSDDS